MVRTKSISFGDRIFARVSKNGQTVFNFVSEKVANMGDLVAQLRVAMKDIQGLVMVHIRNYNQGWGEQRPLMLYASKSQVYSSPSYIAGRGENASQPGRKMLFPWETH